MSTVLHMSAFSPTPYGLKEKSVESFAPAFTSVNGRSSVSPPNEQTPAPAGGSTTWSPVSRPPENGYHSPSDSVSSASSAGNTSPGSPNNKRRRSDSEEHSHGRPSPNDSPTSQTGYRSASRDEPSAMENPQQHSLPPSDRSETEKRWAAESHEMPHHGYQELQHRDSRPTESNHNGVPSSQHVSIGALNDSNGHDERDSTRPGVQVDLKKRKRQFANRTKTGCGTCRRRKKKCDEAKPECNNCTRGGFICEGYATKIPWPKNGISKPPPPLQAKERMTVEISSVYARCPVCNQVHIPHCEPPRQSSYPETHQVPNGTDGARGRPINVEEHDRKPPAPSSWNGWSEQQPPPPRPTYQPEPPPPTQYAQPSSNHERQPSHEHQTVPHQRQDLPPQRQPPSGRVYHHTPQSMSQVVTNLPAASPYSLPNSSTSSAPTELSPRHQVAQHPRQPHPPPPSSSMAPSTAAPPRPAPSHYPQQSMIHKSEKEKMLAGEPFLPYDRQLADERQHCIGAVYRFNSTSNAAVNIASDERARSFRTIVSARWIPPRNGEIVVSHLGSNVQVTTPFHCDYGYNLSFADNIVIGSGCQLLDSARICIGRNTRIGSRVTISTMKSPTDTKSLKGSNGTEVAQQVLIGENVYIGDGVIIEAGVRIGDHAIVRAGSVVVRDLPPHCIAHGNPAFG